ncbi:ABC transporter substrate-binding protein [Thermoanaerobacterium sp. DL9XJH110]|uniref:ABC transporter substrate-binding protein n=1 Tax=Thermoanaerobacterium sp. DL9XJH110 TaxID=3386643 RepID=UPI003BB584DD
MRKTKIVSAVLLLAIFLTACSNSPAGSAQEKKSGGQTSSGPKSGGGVAIAAVSPLALDPLQVQTDEEKAIAGLIYEGLVKIDEQGRIQPGLAKSWDISDDGRTYTFYLRDGVKWHDGKIFTSADVKATFDRIVELRKKQKNQGRAPLFPEFDNIESFSATGEGTFVVSLYKPDAGFLYAMARGILPASLIQVQRDAEKRAAGPGQNALQAVPVGTGKYRFVKKDSESILLKRNENYYGKKPYIEDITIKIFPDKNSMKEALKHEKVDIIPVDPQDWGIFQGISHINLIQYSSRYFEFMALNLNKSIFKDANVRRAILMGIDRNKILQDTTLGKGIVIDGPVLPFSWAYNSQIRHITFNQASARQILKEAGWADTDGDGILEKKISGKRQRFEFEMLVNTSNSARYQAAMDIQKNLQEIGVRVKIINIPWDELEKRVLDKKYDAALMGWKLSPNPDLRFMFSSSEIKNGYNFVSYSNPQLDEILIKAQASAFEEERRTFLFRAQEIIANDVPYIFLYSPGNLLAVNKKIKGVRPDPVNLFNSIEEWWVE